MQDYFDKCQNIDGSKPPEIEEELGVPQRSQSVEDDLRMIRIVGAKNLRKSTQGYLLLRAGQKKVSHLSVGH